MNNYPIATILGAGGTIAKRRVWSYTGYSGNDLGSVQILTTIDLISCQYKDRMEQVEELFLQLTAELNTDIMEWDFLFTI